jgi:hypothetical protein
MDFAVFYSFVYNVPADGLTEAETCRRDIINDKRLFIIDCAINVSVQLVLISDSGVFAADQYTGVN